MLCKIDEVEDYVTPQPRLSFMKSPIEIDPATPENINTRQTNIKTDIFLKNHFFCFIIV